MNNEIRVLALNDGNNYTNFYFEDSSTCFNLRNIVNLLASAHSDKVIIRYVYLPDIPDDDIKAQTAFDVIDWRMTRVISWREAFDFLWDVYAKEW